MWWRYLFLLFIPLYHVGCDLYGHTPRCSNNRLDGQGRERTTNNRLCDTQNNNRAGYNVGGADDRKLILTNIYNKAKTINKTGVRAEWEEKQGPPGKMKYYEGSVLHVTWTNQHECGGQNANCEIVLQYMCDDNLRDGIEDKIIPDNINNCDTGENQETRSCDEDRRFGLHENFRYYTLCKNTKRNTRLYAADQQLINKHTAKSTRQNKNGNRNGYECPEERDYYPYWRPSPWIDIAVMTGDMERCEMYRNESENVKPRYYCKVSEKLIQKLIKERREDYRIPITEGACAGFDYEGTKGEWVQDNRPKHPPPECIKTPRSRDNHHGNGADGFFLSYNWTIPNTPHKHCALRMRYNISTAETPWEKDQAPAETRQLKAANARKLRCKGATGCCTEQAPCKPGEGDCDRHSQCMVGLVCGSDNSPWDNRIDVCMPDKYQIRAPSVKLVSANASSVLDNSPSSWGPRLAFSGRSHGDAGYFHSIRETNPWVRMQIEPAVLSSITIINRKNCCGNRLKNVEVHAGTTSELLKNPIVGRFKGPGESRGEYVIPFEKPVLVKYITIQIIGTRQLLQVNGISVNETATDTCPEMALDYSRNDIRNIRNIRNIQTWQACGKKCGERADCAAWTWSTQKRCYLKNKNFRKGRQRHLGAISGVKGCVEAAKNQSNEPVKEDAPVAATDLERIRREISLPDKLDEELDELEEELTHMEDHAVGVAEEVEAKDEVEERAGSSGYIHLGCFTDRRQRAISGNYFRFNYNTVIQQCYEKARTMGYKVFAVQYNTECFTSANAHKTYDKYGTAKWCSNGRGGGWKQDVYLIEIAPAITSGPFNITNEEKNRANVTLVPEKQLQPLKHCPLTRRKIKTDYKFYIQRDDSTSVSTFTYWRFDLAKMETFKFNVGQSDHTEVSYDGYNLICKGNSKGQHQCNGLPVGKSVPAVVASLNFDPMGGRAHNNEWSRNRYSLHGSNYESSCQPGQGPEITFGPYSLTEQDQGRIQVTLVSGDQFEALKYCPSSQRNIDTDVKFYIQRDDSTSMSMIKYWRFDYQQVESFTFNHGYSDHTHVTYDGHSLICTGNGKGHHQCNNLPLKKHIAAVVISIDFNPRSGRARNNQWFRNKYSLHGGYYDSTCRSASQACATKGKCENGKCGEVDAKSKCMCNDGYAMNKLNICVKIKCDFGFEKNKDGYCVSVGVYNPPPRCRGEDNGCCTKETPCDYGEGDCDTHDQCKGPLVCGFKNCFHTFGRNDDCCTDNIVAKLVGGDPNELEKRGFIFKNDPTVQPLSVFDGDDNLGKLFNLDLAINTAQFGRTFQDRSHEFSILERPEELKTKKIYNMEVRGKRGNIVQVYPSTEYDYSPNRLNVQQGDHLHIQWTGSERNPNNAGNGRARTDRSNMLLMAEQNYVEGTGKAVPPNLKNGHWGRSYPNNIVNDDGKTLLGFSRKDQQSLALSDDVPLLPESELLSSKTAVKVVSSSFTTSLELTCGTNEEIRVVSAHYGGKCAGEGLNTSLGSDCNKCTGFKSMEHLKNACDREQQCLLYARNQDFAYLGTCNGVDGYMQVSYKCLKIPDRVYSCAFGRGLARGKWIRINNQDGEDCVESCWRRKFVNTYITGVAVRSDRRNKECNCVAYGMTTDTNNLRFKTCFFNYKGRPSRPDDTVKCPEVDWDYTGNDMRRISNINTWQECSKQCGKQQNCHAFTWVTPYHESVDQRKRCYLKNKNFRNGRKRLLGVISAHKGCMDAPAAATESRRLKEPAMPPLGSNYNTSTYRCNGQNDGCCTTTTPCDLYEGDCDSHLECKGRLECGNNNCPWGDGDGCCQEPSYLDLDAAPHYFNLEPKELSVEGEFKYMCSRNNDFTNRSQKGKIKVSKAEKKDETKESPVTMEKVTAGVQKDSTLRNGMDKFLDKLNDMEEELMVE